MITINKKPNHVCKLSSCRQKYWVCNDCDKQNSWRAIGCCFEHAMAYQEEVLAARSGSLTIDDKKEMWKADRIDDAEMNIDDSHEVNTIVLADESVVDNIFEIPIREADIQYPKDTYTIASEEDKQIVAPRKPRKKRYNYNDGQEDA